MNSECRSELEAKALRLHRDAERLMKKNTLLSAELRVARAEGQEYREEAVQRLALQAKVNVLTTKITSLRHSLQKSEARADAAETKIEKLASSSYKSIAATASATAMMAKNDGGSGVGRQDGNWDGRTGCGAVGVVGDEGRYISTARDSRTPHYGVVASPRLEPEKSSTRRPSDLRGGGMPLTRTRGAITGGAATRERERRGEKDANVLALEEALRDVSRRADALASENVRLGEQLSATQEQQDLALKLGLRKSTMRALEREREREKELTQDQNERERVMGGV